MAVANWIEIGRMDELGRLDTPVHRIDARAKALTTLLFIVSVMSYPRYSLSALMPMAIYPVFMTSVGRIPAGVILRKLLVASPFAILIGLFNPMIDRAPMLSLGPVEISGGWLSFASILARFALTVGAALALVSCTGMHRLAWGLRGLGVPRVFVQQLLFLYRYLFVIVDDGARVLRGIQVRAGGLRALRPGAYGAVTGHLLLRSMDRAERVYRAMVARGFDGEVRVRRQNAFGWMDALFVAAWLGFFAAVRRWNLAAALGGLFTGSAA